MLPLRKILCPTDWSEPSLAALEIAGEWARHFDSELLMLHVVAPLEHSGLLLDKAQIEEAMQADAARQLHEIARHRVLDVPSVRPIVTVGSAAVQIADVARQENVDLLVISTHGLGGWRAVVSGSSMDAIFFGSVTSNVMRLALCPILTIRAAPATDEATGENRYVKTD